jgi:hypothetical protein
MLQRVNINLVYEYKTGNKMNLLRGIHRNEPQFHTALGAFMNELQVINVTNETTIFEPHVSFKIDVAGQNENIEDEQNRFRNEILEDLRLSSKDSHGYASTVHFIIFCF